MAPIEKEIEMGEQISSISFVPWQSNFRDVTGHSGRWEAGSMDVSGYTCGLKFPTLPTYRTIPWPEALPALPLSAAVQAPQSRLVQESSRTSTFGLFEVRMPPGPKNLIQRKIRPG